MVLRAWTNVFREEIEVPLAVGALIGGVLGACSMIAQLAVLIVSKVRSKGIFTKSNTRDYEDTSHVNCSATTYEDIDNTKHKSETATTNQACDIDESVVPVYEEVSEIEIQGILYRNKDEAGTHEPIKCLAGSFAEKNDRRELNITRRSCNHQLKFVCRIGNTSAPTQSQSTLDKGTMQTDSSFDIGAVIGGILAACFMIIVLAVLIVCKIRSKGIFTESNTNNYEDTSRVNFSTATYEDLDNTKHTNLTATTNQACDIDDSSAPVYEEVNTN
ncbi:unnamed protein product [Mytilus edulis]|uniref:Uncharacterized protein n=1 Tax=Mytilus edulis TaxID=6550 RepID=A0A8S3RWM8_MYTED|nr:unnamed protein product [Mytilus edulis]